MKSIIKIGLPISLLLNIWFLYKIYQNYQFRTTFSSHIFSVKKISLDSGTSYLLNRIKKEQPNLVNKKYLFINIWNIGCGPCIKEIPTLDSLSLKIKRKDVGFVFLTENGEKLIASFLKRKQINVQNFVYINDANDYISSILNSKGLKSKSYPIQIIIDKKGNIKYFSRDVVKSSKDSMLIKVIDKLP